MYRCEAVSVTGFVQQLACNYLPHGYHYYVVGEIPERKDPRAVDQRMIARFGLISCRYERARRKKAGFANVQYLRFKSFFVLLATKGEHRFYEEHSAKQIRHIKRRPISFGGYSIGYHRGVDGKWHSSVRIHPQRYRRIKAYMLELATKRSAAELEEEFWRLPFEPYAPVRRQLQALHRAVLRLRLRAGLSSVKSGAVVRRRGVVRPFGD